MFNEEQVEHMRHLASLPRERKCDCGWAVRGHCYGGCVNQPERGGAVVSAETLAEMARMRSGLPTGSSEV